LNNAPDLRLGGDYFDVIIEVRHFDVCGWQGLIGDWLGGELAFNSSIDCPSVSKTLR
jgi:hypothetical protein